jgi:ABC-type Co2+ transport system permease subunit
MENNDKLVAQAAVVKAASSAAFSTAIIATIVMLPIWIGCLIGSVVISFILFCFFGWQSVAIVYGIVAVLVWLMFRK